MTFSIREREAWLPPTPEEDTSWSGFGEWAPEWAAKGVTSDRCDHGLSQERPGNLSHCRQPLEGHLGSYPWTMGKEIRLALRIIQILTILMYISNPNNGLNSNLLDV